MDSRWLKVILLLSSLVFSAITMEILLRVTTDDAFPRAPYPNIEWLVQEPVLGWRNQSGFRTDASSEREYRGEVRINARGFHGVEVPETKAPGSLRIICLGDSGTFGIWWEVAPEREPPAVLVASNGYPHALSTLLQQQGREDVEVVNAGVLGYTTSHGLRQLATKLLELTPDIITVRFGYNDHSMAWNPALRSREPSLPTVRALLYRHHNWKLIRLGMATYQRMSFLHPDSGSVPWVTVDRFERNLERFIEVARERQIRLLFIDYPLRPLQWGSFAMDPLFFGLDGTQNMLQLYERHSIYQTALKKVTTREKVALLETAGVFHEGTRRLFTDADPVHPNRTGSRVLGELLLAKLRGLGWLDPSTR